MSITTFLASAIDSLCFEEVVPTAAISQTDKLLSRPVTVRQITLDACRAFAAYGLEVISAELKGSALVDALFHTLKPTCALNRAPADIDVVISVIVRGSSLAEINDRISHITILVASLLKSYFPTELEPSLSGLSPDKFLLYANQYRFIYPSSMTPCIYRIGQDKRPLELGVWAYWNKKNISQREGIFNCERLFVDLLKEERSLAVSYASYFSGGESLYFWRKQLEELKESEGISPCELADCIDQVNRLGPSCSAADLDGVRKTAIKFMELAEVPLVLEEMKKGLLFCSAPRPMRGAFARFFVKISQGYYDPVPQTLEAISDLSKEGVIKQSVREELFSFVSQKKYPPSYQLAIYLNILLTKAAHPGITSLQKELYALCGPLLLLEGLEGFLSTEVMSIEPLIRPLILRAHDVECRYHQGELCLRLEVYFSNERYFLLVPSSLIKFSSNTPEQERTLLSHKEYRVPFKHGVDAEALKLYSRFFGPDVPIYHYLMMQKGREKIDVRYTLLILEKILENEEFFTNDSEMALRDLLTCLQNLSIAKLPKNIQQESILRLSSLKPEVLGHVSSLKIAHLFEIVSINEEKIEDVATFNKLRQALQTLSKYLFPLMLERARVRAIVTALDMNWGIFLADELERLWLQEPSLTFLISFKHHKEFFSRPAVEAAIKQKAPLECDAFLSLADCLSSESMTEILTMLSEKQVPLEELSLPPSKDASSLAAKLSERAGPALPKGELFFAIHYADSRYFPLLRDHVLSMPSEDMLKKMYLIAVMYWRLLSGEKAHEINTLLSVTDERWANLGFHATKWLIDNNFNSLFRLWKKQISHLTSGDIDYGVDVQYFNFLTTFVPFKPAFQEEGFAKLIKLFDEIPSSALFFQITDFFNKRRLPLSHGTKLIASIVRFTEDRATKIEPEAFINEYLIKLQPFLEFQNEYVSWEIREKFLHVLLKLKIFLDKTSLKAAEYIAGMFSHVMLMPTSTIGKEILLTSTEKFIKAFLLIEKKNVLSRVVILSSLQSFIMRSDRTSSCLPHFASLWESVLTDEVFENAQMRALAVSSCTHLFKLFCESSSRDSSQYETLMLLTPLIMKKGVSAYIDYLQIGCAISYFYRFRAGFTKDDVSIILSWVHKFPLNFVVTQTKKTLQTPLLISLFFEIREIIVAKKMDFSTHAEAEEMAYLRTCQERLYRFMFALVKEYDNEKLDVVLSRFRTSHDDPSLMRKHLDSLA